MKLRFGRRLSAVKPVNAAFSGTGWGRRGAAPVDHIDITFHYAEDEYPRRRFQVDMTLAEAEQLLEAFEKTVRWAREENAKLVAGPCPERKDGGPHEFTPDMEYDSTGETINCEHCGEPKP